MNRARRLISFDWALKLRQALRKAGGVPPLLHPKKLFGTGR